MPFKKSMQDLTDALQGIKDSIKVAKSDDPNMPTQSKTQHTPSKGGGAAYALDHMEIHVRARQILTGVDGS